MKRPDLSLLLPLLCACAHPAAPPPAAADPKPGAGFDVAAERAAVQALEAETVAIGRRLTAELWANEAAVLHARFSEPMRAAFPAEKWQATQAQIVQGLQGETELLAEGTLVIGTRRSYWRVSSMKGAPGRFKTLWVVDAAGTVYSFLISAAEQAAPTEHLGAHQATALALPFEGTWYVAWGGPDIERNYHAKTKDQRFALDLLQVRGGRTFSGDGRQLTDYYAYGQPVLATAAGVIAAVGDGVEDNAVGAMNPKQAFGNFVVIDHENGEFSMYAHLQPGSLQVAPGDRVTPGQRLGRCGNSGNTSEPHIHYHLQTTPEHFKGEGLPAVFGRAVVDGVEASEVQLRGGQFVSP